MVFLREIYDYPLDMRMSFLIIIFLRDLWYAFMVCCKNCANVPLAYFKRTELRRFCEHVKIGGPFQIIRTDSAGATLDIWLFFILKGNLWLEHTTKYIYSSIKRPCAYSWTYDSKLWKHMFRKHGLSQACNGPIWCSLLYWHATVY